MQHSARDYRQLVDRALDGDGESCWSVRYSLLHSSAADNTACQAMLLERDIDPTPLFAESLLIKGAMESKNGHCCWTLSQAIVRPHDAESQMRLDALHNYGYAPTRDLSDQLIVQGAIDGHHSKCSWLARHAVLEPESERSMGRIRILQDRGVATTPIVADAFLLKSSLSGHNDAMKVTSCALEESNGDLSRSLNEILRQTGISITRQFRNSLNLPRRLAKDNILSCTATNLYQRSLSRFIQPGLQISQ